MMNEFQFDKSEIIGNWECDECGFTYRSAISGRLMQCPQCGAPGESFSFWSDADDEELDIAVSDDRDATGFVEGFDDLDDDY